MSGESPNILRAGALTVLPELGRAAWHGKVIDLTPGELRLVIYFLRNLNRIVTKEELDKAISENGSYSSGATAPILIHRVRGKTSRDLIITRRGLGYIIEEHMWPNAR